MVIMQKIVFLFNTICYEVDSNERSEQ
jgi:hypothetical protein